MLRRLVLLCWMGAVLGCRGEAPEPAEAGPAGSAASADGMPLAAFRVEPKSDKPNRYRVDHDALFQLIALARAGRLPVTPLPDGAIKVDRAPAGSVLALVGLREGDELASLNAIALTAPEVLSTMHDALRRDGVLELAIRRGGESLVLTYEVPPFAALPSVVVADSDHEEEPRDDAGGASDAGVDGIEEAGEGRYRIPRASVDRWFASTAELSRTYRVRPTPAGKQPAGLKVFGIRAGSLPSRLGLQNGDVVVSVNGRPLSSPEQALSAYRDVREAAVITVAVDRRGRPVTLEYRIEP